MWTETVNKTRSARCIYSNGTTRFGGDDITYCPGRVSWHKILSKWSNMTSHDGLVEAYGTTYCRGSQLISHIHNVACHDVIY